MVYPINKSDNSQYIDDFRPISITVIFRRLFENLLKNRVFTNDFIDKNISKYQTGFRSNYNILHQVIYLNDSYNLNKNT